MSITIPMTVLRVSPDVATANRKCRCCSQVIPKGAPHLVNLYSDGKWMRKDNICMACAPDVKAAVIENFDKAVSEANRLAIADQKS